MSGRFKMWLSGFLGALMGSFAGVNIGVGIFYGQDFLFLWGLLGVGISWVNYYSFSRDFFRRNPFSDIDRIAEAR